MLATTSVMAVSAVLSAASVATALNACGPSLRGRVDVEVERGCFAAASGHVVDAEGHRAHGAFGVHRGDLKGHGASDRRVVVRRGEEDRGCRGVAGVRAVGGRQEVGQVGEEGLATSDGNEGDGEGRTRCTHDHSACPT
jgi:hypothetical protein